MLDVALCLGGIWDLNIGSEPGLQRKGFGFIITLQINFVHGQLFFCLLRKNEQLDARKNKLFLLNSGSPAWISDATSYAVVNMWVVTIMHVQIQSFMMELATCSSSEYSFVKSYICFSSLVLGVQWLIKGFILFVWSVNLRWKD